MDGLFGGDCCSLFFSWEQFIEIMCNHKLFMYTNMS